MSITSPEYILFSALCVFFFYVLPKAFRPYTLLCFSIAFYCFAGVGGLVYLFSAALVTYISALILCKLQSKKGKKFVVGLCCILCFGLLFSVKYLIVFLPDFKRPDFIVPLGLSFYIFQSTGYVIDVYRNKTAPQKNFLKYLLFVSFFPQIIQGPIGRYGTLSKSLWENKQSFDINNLISGIFLMLWGYFKKLVIADRASLFVVKVFDDGSGEFGGSIILFAVILYCIQLYCDFSGGIDIIRGLSLSMGITLGQNFKRPVFADSLSDFWRRWHISLGSWMREYVFYPISFSKPFVALGKFCRAKINGKAGKILPVSAATFIVYFLIGIWHGGNLKYIVFGLYNGILITAALLCEPVFLKIKSFLKINDTSLYYKVFKIIRTNIIVIAGRYITRSASVGAAAFFLSKTFCDFKFSELFTPMFFKFGLTGADYIIILLGVLLVFAVELTEEAKGIKTREWILEKPRRIYFSALILGSLVTLFGIYRGSYISSEFIYRQF